MKAAAVGHLPPLQPAADVGGQVPPLGIRANADQPDQARDRLQLRRARHRALPDRAHVLRRRPDPDRPEDDPRRQREAIGARRSNELLPLQRGDFYGVFKEMHGTPVTIRTIDPPLHEFLPEARRPDGARSRSSRRPAKTAQGARRDEDAAAPRRAAARVQPDARPSRRAVWASRIRRSRRCRRARSSKRPASSRRKGSKVVPEIMIPLVGDVRELQRPEGGRRARRRRRDEGAGRQGRRTWSGR